MIPSVKVFMDIFNSIGERLREVREEMGLSQTAFAEFAESAGAAGTTRQSQSLYEKGKRMPDAAYLSAIAANGADVLYILTGHGRSQSLSQDEQELITAFRAAPLAVKGAVIGALSAGASAPPPGKKTKQVVRGSVGQQAGGDIVNQKGNKIEIGKAAKTGGARKR